MRLWESGCARQIQTMPFLTVQAGERGRRVGARGGDGGYGGRTGPGRSRCGRQRGKSAVLGCFARHRFGVSKRLLQSPSRPSPVLPQALPLAVRPCYNIFLMSRSKHADFRPLDPLSWLSRSIQVLRLAARNCYHPPGILTSGPPPLHPVLIPSRPPTGAAAGGAHLLQHLPHVALGGQPADRKGHAHADAQRGVPAHGGGQRLCKWLVGFPHKQARVRPS